MCSTKIHPTKIRPIKIKPTKNAQWKVPIENKEMQKFIRSNSDGELIFFDWIKKKTEEMSFSLGYDNGISADYRVYYFNNRAECTIFYDEVMKIKHTMNEIVT